MKDKIIQELRADAATKLSKLPKYDGVKALQLRWPKQVPDEGLGYDVVDYHKGAVAGYVMGKVVDEKTTIALFALSSGEWAAAIAPAKPPFLFDGLFQFEIIDDQSNSTCFKRVEKLLRGICYEADGWLLYQHSKQIALIHKPTGRKWDFSNSVGGGGEDLGSFIWPVEPEHARTIAATLAFARMWLYGCDFS